MLDGNDGIGHALSRRRRSDQISKTLFRFPKLADTQPQEKTGDDEAEPEAGPIELTLSTKNAPAKPVDDPDHRVKGIGETPLLRNDVRTEPYRRHIKT